MSKAVRDVDDLVADQVNAIEAAVFATLHEVDRQVGPLSPFVLVAALARLQGAVIRPVSSSNERRMYVDLGDLARKEAMVSPETNVIKFARPTPEHPR